VKTPLTPIDLMVLLHYHCFTEPLPGFPSCSDPELRSTQMWLQSGMIKPRGEQTGYYVTTDKGNAFVLAMCKLPEPVTTWIVP